MTISTNSSAITVSGNGATTSFTFPFIADEASDITVTYTDADGNQTILQSSQYNLVINAPAVNQLWGVGGTLTYPISGPPIAMGTTLTIQRNIPFTQEVSIQNQGNFYAQVTEQALDLLEMQIQQVAARTGQLRGTWATGIKYNFGDIVQDGINGTNTLNYYICAIADTSGVWATDLANGDWSIVINIQELNGIIGAYLPLAGGTISGNLAVTGSTSLNGISTAVTPAANDSSTKIATTAFVAGTIRSVKRQIFTSSGTYTPSTGMVYCLVEAQGGGGGGGGTPSTGASQFASGTGGGAGGYCNKIYPASAIGVSQTVTIGAAGSVTAGANGGAGGNTTFGALLTANGGAGGTVGTAFTNTTFLVLGSGTGGTASGGDFNEIGQSGAGSMGVVGTGGFWCLGGTGGSSQLGRGGLGNPANVGPQTGNATGYGAGGAGTASGNSQSAQAGGTATAGIIIITEYCTQ